MVKNLKLREAMAFAGIIDEDQSHNTEQHKNTTEFTKQNFPRDHGNGNNKNNGVFSSKSIEKVRYNDKVDNSYEKTKKSTSPIKKTTTPMKKKTKLSTPIKTMTNLTLMKKTTESTTTENIVMTTNTRLTSPIKIGTMYTIPKKTTSKPTTPTKSTTPAKSATPKRASLEMTPLAFTSTPRKSPSMKQVGVADMVASSFHVLNMPHDDEVQCQPHMDEPDDDEVQHQYHHQNVSAHGEYGYNDPSFYGTNQTVPMPMQNLINYYQSLDHSTQGHVLSFLNMMVNELNGMSYGVSVCTEENNSLHTSISPSVASPSTQIEERRQILITDSEEKFADVKVNPTALRTAEQRALTIKQPAAYLLNKVLEMVFSKEELIEAKGYKGLNQHKLEAIHEYMFARCKHLDIQRCESITFNSIIQNKLGNTRYKALHKGVKTQKRLD